MSSLSKMAKPTARESMRETPGTSGLVSADADTVRVVTGDRVDLFLVVAAPGQRGQAAEDHHVVDGCRVVVRGVRNRSPGPSRTSSSAEPPRRCAAARTSARVAHEVGAVEVDPDKAVVRRALGAASTKRRLPAVNSTMCTGGGLCGLNRPLALDGKRGQPSFLMTRRRRMTFGPRPSMTALRAMTRVRVI